MLKSSCQSKLFRPSLATELDRAAFKPPLVVGVEAENVLGTGEASGLQGAELTLSLASVLERGGKLDARRTLAQSRIDVLAVEREARRLDLLAEVARRYQAIVGAQKRCQGQFRIFLRRACPAFRMSGRSKASVRLRRPAKLMA